ncbi:MAG: hypothetical protein ACOYNC_05285 [Bacteroidales bacterium]
MKKFIKFHLVPILFFPIICTGQIGINVPGFIPSLIPPSPNAYELGKYGQIPVGLYTGSVNFDLPLYIYKTNHLTLPISLQYSSNGIKVDQIESNVGLGWNLNTGGVVTKIDRNRADGTDQCMYPPQELFNVNDPVAIAFFNSVGNWNGDAEPDLFMFNFMGHSGKFVYDKDANIVLMPLQDIKIEEDENSGYMITCSDGIKYYFDESEEVMSRLSGFTPPPSPINTTNAWYLTKIVHPYGDTILLEYDTANCSYYTSVCETVTIFDPPGQTACGNYEANIPTINGPFKFKSTIAGKRLKKIYSANTEENGEVDFISNYNSIGVSGFKLISSILVKDRNQTEIERFDFNYNSYQTNKRVFLNKVTFKDISKYYHFEYIKPDSLPVRLSYGQDHWGYYNGENNNIHFYPNIPDNIYFSGLNGANKESNGVFSNIGLLEKITYPTKGYSKLFYEPNDYYGLKHIPGHYSTRSLDVVTNDEGWGSAYADSVIIENVADQKIQIFVDVAEIYNQGGAQCYLDPEHKAASTLKIKDNSTGFLVPLFIKTTYGYMPRINDIFYPNGVDNGCYANLEVGKFYTIILTPKWKCMTSHASIKYLDIAPSEYLANIECGGQRIKKVVNHDPCKIQDDISRYYYYKKDRLEESSGVVGEKGLYITPTVAQIQCSDYIQEPIYYQVLSASSLCPLFNTNNNNVYYPNVTVSHGGDNFENGGELHEFMNNLDSRGVTLKGQEILGAAWTNFGWMTGLENKNTVFKLGNNGDRIILREDTIEYFNDCTLPNKEVVGYAIRKNYNNLLFGPTTIDNLDVTKYKNISYWKYQKSSTVKQYDQNGLNPVFTKINNFYDNINHLQLTRTESVASNNDSLRTISFYPQDVEQDPNLTKLISQYRIAEKIKEEEYLKIPNSTEWQKISTKEVNFKDWGGNIIHPSYIAVSTFNNPLEPRSRFYVIDSTNGNPMEFSQENDVHSAYIWGYQKTKPVIEGKNVSFNNLNTAVNQTNPNLDQLLSTYGVGDLTNPTQRAIWKEFNENLRRQPLILNTMVNTYTYKQLIGITSSTDPSGLTTYFEYDNLGRLIYVRNNNYQIVKKYDYHYSTTIEK